MVWSLTKIPAKKADVTGYGYVMYCKLSPSICTSSGGGGRFGCFGSFVSSIVMTMNNKKPLRATRKIWLDNEGAYYVDVLAYGLAHVVPFDLFDSSAQFSQLNKGLIQNALKGDRT